MTWWQSLIASLASTFPTIAGLIAGKPREPQPAPPPDKMDEIDTAVDEELAKRKARSAAAPKP